MYQDSFRARRAIESPVTTVLADGMACRVPDPARWTRCCAKPTMWWR
jgi:hypothetical protein